MLNEVKVIICGKEYKIKTASSPNYVYALARALEPRAENNHRPHGVIICGHLINKCNVRAIEPVLLLVGNPYEGRRHCIVYQECGYNLFRTLSQ